MIFSPEGPLLLSNIDVASAATSFFPAILMHFQIDGPKII